jgi:alkylation response protein AidB-like acyl-CoA dehydrogenase
MLATDADIAAALCAAHAAQADLDGRLSGEVIEAIRSAGFARHFVPRRWNGTQGTFTDCLHAAAQVAAADASAGWCASIAASMGRMAAFLPEQGQQALWDSGPDAFVAGTLLPAGTARPVTGGWQVSGRWPFVTGIQFSDWALLSCRITPGDGTPDARSVLVPRAAYGVEETWHSAGMRATRSDTLILHETFIPSGHSFSRQELLDGRATATGTCYCLPHDAVSGLSFAAPLLGAASGALQAWVHGARLRTASRLGSGRRRELALARSAGEIDAAQLLLERAAASADRPPLTPLEAVRARRDYALAASLLVQSVNRLFRTAGTQATTQGGAFPRLWRDVNAASVHPALDPEPAAGAYADCVLE